MHLKVLNVQVLQNITCTHQALATAVCVQHHHCSSDYSLRDLHFFGLLTSSGVPRNFVRGGGGSTNSVEGRGQRERGSGGSSPLVRGSGGSCNLVQEISFHILKFS